MNNEKIKELYYKEAEKSKVPEKIGISRSNFDGIMNGIISPNVQTLEKIAKYFGKSIGYFFDEPQADDIMRKSIEQQMALSEKEIEIMYKNNKIADLNFIISTQKELIEYIKTQTLGEFINTEEQKKKSSTGTMTAQLPNN